jgi:acyl-homoserine-lactone acylase
MEGEGHGNSYLQIVAFGNQHVDAYTLLSTSQSDDPASNHYRDASRLYAEKHWLHFPFEKSNIEQKMSEDTTILGF